MDFSQKNFFRLKIMKIKGKLQTEKIKQMADKVFTIVEKL